VVSCTRTFPTSTIPQQLVSWCSQLRGTASSSSLKLGKRSFRLVFLKTQAKSLHINICSLCIDELRLFLFQVMEKSNSLSAISAAVKASAASHPSACGAGPELRHFLYKARTVAQYTGPPIKCSPHYFHEQCQQRLLLQYLRLQARLHSQLRPFKFLYYAGERETIIGWVRRLDIRINCLLLKLTTLYRIPSTWKLLHKCYCLAKMQLNVHLIPFSLDHSVVWIVRCLCALHEQNSHHGHHHQQTFKVGQKGGKYNLHPECSNNLIC